MSLDWFKPRGYRHFDLPVDDKFAARAMDPAFVARHPFSPLLHYTKSEKRYKKDAKSGVRTITTKDRPIKYASHRDACILAYYAHQLNLALEKLYLASGLSENVIAYRSLGKGNYDFSAEVLAYTKANAPVTILAFDVTGFFDNLDHGLLKQRLKTALGVTSLTEDWHKVFRSFTAFHFVDLEELKAHAIFGPRLAARSRDRIAGVEELKTAGVIFHPNPEIKKGKKRGIPQGTPISAAASNLYMIDFDAAAKAHCDGIGALYRRYSDDIMVVCDPAQAVAVEAEVMRLIASELLEINPAKTERTDFGAAVHLPRSSRAAQYLGFTLHEDGPAIRESSLSRQWRKMRRAMKRIRKVATAKIAAGVSDGAHTKRLRRRFSHLKVRDDQGIRTIRNFSSYGRRSAAVFGSDEKITGQVKRFERAAQKELAELKALGKPKVP
jgi:RNA-directed DNA polymerase